MSKKQGGFTLIELILVIVILGILAVVALPRFIDLQTEAAQAATDGVAGALSSGSAINYAASLAGSADAVGVADCGDAAGTIQGGSMPSGYQVTNATSTTTVAPGATETSCEVENIDEGTTATFTVHGVSA